MDDRARWALAVLACASLAAAACGDDGATGERPKSVDASVGVGDGAVPDAETGECGNFELERGEVCDDGNTVDGDGCSGDCTSDESCGNGTLDPGERCDDGNTRTGDGCSADCQGDESCGDGRVDLGAGEVCDDGNTESGDGCAADCVSDESCGNGVVDEAADETCDDGNTEADDGCSAECRLERCGNGSIDDGETCDDGNAEDDDGCDADCTWSCEVDDDCDAAGECAVARCVDHVCTGEPVADGATCDRDSDPSTRELCVSGVCMASVCGDGYRDDTEMCDDGNDVSGDGCDSDCTWTCDADSECSDGNPCNGIESCDPDSHVCVTATAPSAGTVCDRDADATTRDVCRGERCVSSVCGDGFVDTGTEQCDDGNTEDGDGCDGDCTWSCTADADCDDGNACNGTESCDPDTHTCGGGSTVSDGTVCDRDGDAGTRDICRSASCVRSLCGDGYVDSASEDCEDGNAVNGDGCDADCTWSCTGDGDCDDGKLCNGSEACDLASHTCEPGTVADDGDPCGTGRVCVGGACTTTSCGNGTVEYGEECDDGNGTDEDGCDGDCTWSCSAHVDCDDGNACNGAESCDLTSHTCDSGPLEDDGTSCGSGRVCLSGSCITPVCGNGSLEPGESCDDGNEMDGDGCDADCSWSCTADGDCDDGKLCSGAESCDLASHTCDPGVDADDGTSCGTGRVCLTGTCIAPVCGNGALEPGETCDDGNATDADGCDADCTYSCTGDGDCDDGLVCNGAESCDIASHTCVAGTAADDGTVCDRDGDAGTRDVCQTGACQTSICGDGYVDATRGEACDDGNATAGDGCENDCSWTCTEDAGCDDGNVCNGAELCDLETHTCTVGSTVPDGTVCDADGMGGTRDLCIGDSCQLTACGDGYVDGAAGETCDDGNLTDGDGCESDCTATPSAFRVTQMNLRDPHLFKRILWCSDVTSTANSEIQADIDGYDLSIVLVSRPLDLDQSTNVAELYTDASCTAGTPDECTVGAEPAVDSVLHNELDAGTTCYEADAATLNDRYSEPNAPSGPCFVSDPESVAVSLNGAPIPLQQARIAATYSGGSPPTQYVAGVISGFITEADAMTTVIPLPVFGDTPMYDLLAGGGSCQGGWDDRDDLDGDGTVDGWWLYLDFVAEEVNWSDP